MKMKYLNISIKKRRSIKDKYVKKKKWEQLEEELLPKKMKKNEREQVRIGAFFILWKLKKLIWYLKDQRDIL